MKRVLLKLSGEALAGEKKTGFDEATCIGVAKQVKQLVDDGVQVAIVTGGGNFWRGRTSETIDRVKADQIGMLATVMNCIYVSDIFRFAGMETEVFTPFVCGAFTTLFSKDKAVEALNQGKVVFFAGGTGHPYFSTDTGAVLRAIEIEADAMLLAKAIDGIYDSDPKVNSNMNEKLKVYDTKMQKTMDSLDSEMGTIRAGRANPNVLNRIMVDYYGTPTPIQQVANVSVPEPRMIQIQPWEKSMLKVIEKAIMVSDLGINPTNDGTAVRLIFPELTEERRKELVKDVKKKGEAAKVAIRNIRRDGNDAFKKLKGSDVSEDEIKNLEDELQKMTDKYVKEIDSAVEVKSKEVMTV